MMNRRQVLRWSSAAGVASAAAYLSRRWARPYNNQIWAATSLKRDLLRAPVKVPADFVGMHFHRRPEGSPPSSPPTYGFGMVRSHDYGARNEWGVKWSSVHLGPNRFQWETLDRWVDTYANAGKTIIYTMYGTPTWIASLPAASDPYGMLGGCSPPLNMSAAAEFIHALVTRYNQPSRRRIQFIEIWNEPTFRQKECAFWLGPAHHLVALGKTIYQTAKAADPGIKILSPGFNSFGSGGLSELTFPNENAIFDYLSSHDGSGGTGSRWCDAIAIHTYEAEIAGPTHGIEALMTRVRGMLDLLSMSCPIYNTEIGYEQTVTSFYRAGLIEKAVLLRRQAAVQAALGIQAMCFYSHDDNLIGNPSLHPEISQAINDIQLGLAGKTLRQVSVSPVGTVEVTTSAGVVQW